MVMETEVDMDTVFECFDLLLDREPVPACCSSSPNTHARGLFMAVLPWIRACMQALALRQ
jgi:hypothetical protein